LILLLQLGRNKNKGNLLHIKRTNLNNKYDAVDAKTIKTLEQRINIGCELSNEKLV